MAFQKLSMAEDPLRGCENVEPVVWLKQWKAKVTFLCSDEAKTNLTADEMSILWTCNGKEKYLSISSSVMSDSLQPHGL